MAALASMLPSFIKRRKRSADEEQACELRAALEAAPRSALVDKCLELHAANQRLSRHVRDVERDIAARDDAAAEAMRATVRDELARSLRTVPRWTFGAEGESEPESDAGDGRCELAAGAEASAEEASSDLDTSDDDDAAPSDPRSPDEAPTSLPPAPQGEAGSAVASEAAQLAAQLEAERETERERLMSLSSGELDASDVNAFAVNAHEPEALQYDNKPTFSDIKDWGSLPPAQFHRARVRILNLRAAPITLAWVDQVLGVFVLMGSKEIAAGSHETIATLPDHVIRAYDADSGVFLGFVEAAPAYDLMRSLFGFDGFIGASLRAAVEAFKAVPYAPELRDATLYVIT